MYSFTEVNKFALMYTTQILSHAAADEAFSSMPIGVENQGERNEVRTGRTRQWPHFLIKVSH